MGEESDGDANLLDESDSQSEPSEEVDEPTAESTPESDAPDTDSSDADESDSPESEQPSASPPEATAEDGGTSSSTEPSVAEPESDEADEGDDDEASEGDGNEDEDDSEDGADESGDNDDSSGNIQAVDPPDVSLDPDQLDPNETPTQADPEQQEPQLERREPDPERRKPPAEGRKPRPEQREPPAERPDRPPEPADRPDAESNLPGPPDVHRPPDMPETTEGGSAPLAEDVATGREGVENPESFDEAAQRSEPLEDEEMPLADHIEEMLKRLAVVIVIAGVVSLAVLPVSETAINFLWNSVLPGGETTRPRIYGPLGLVFTKLKVASLAGLVIALPVFVYETYQFMRPGLYPHERRYYLAAIPTSLVLAFVGISFAYFLILPVIFEYFLYYSEDVTTIAFALTKTFNLILLLMGYLAIVFQIPLFIMLAIMMGLTTRRWLVERRLYFWGAFLGISFLFSPDPTGMAPIMVATTMVGLFEGTLFLLRWTGR